MRHFFWHLCGVLLFVAVAALLSFAVMLLWNALLPGIAGLPAIGYWKAAGLLVLARILFGGIGHGGGWGRLRHRNFFHDKWRNMGEEERNAFMKRFSK